MSGPVLVLFEDAKFRGLGDLLRQALAVQGRVPQQDALRFESVFGDGNFAGTIAMHVNTPIDGAPPRCVVCLADADAPHHLVPGAPPIQTPAEHRRFRGLWRRHLRAQPNLQGNARRVRTAVLRWSQESLWTAAPEAVRAWSGVDDTFFAACTPNPTSAGVDVLRYRDPLGCLNQAARAGRNRPFKKNVDNNDLGYHAIALLPQLERRHPDFRHLVRVLRRALR